MGKSVRARFRAAVGRFFPTSSRMLHGNAGCPCVQAVSPPPGFSFAGVFVPAGNAPLPSCRRRQIVSFRAFALSGSEGGRHSSCWRWTAGCCNSDTPRRCWTCCCSCRRGARRETTSAAHKPKPNSRRVPQKSGLLALILNGILPSANQSAGLQAQLSPLLISARV